MKKTLITLLFVGIFIPSLVSAKWWNPFTWRSQPAPTTTITVPVQPVAIPEGQPAQPAEASVLAPTTIIKTITVEDPTLQNQIAELQKENSVLKARIAVLESENLDLTTARNIPPQKSKDQIMAAYELDHPRPAPPGSPKCKYDPSVDKSSYATQGRCLKEYTDWITSAHAFVDQELQNQ